MGVDRAGVGWFCLLCGVGDETEFKHFCYHLILDFVRLNSSRSSDFGVVVWYIPVLVGLGGGVGFALGAGRHGEDGSIRGATRVTRRRFAKT